MVVSTLLVFAIAGVLPTSKAVEFGEQIQPILARSCFPCHGPDDESREAGLRLDSREAAVEAGAIDVETLSDSALLERIYSDDPELLMPPPESGRKLDDSQKQLLTQWLESGARYELHWSFVAPKKADLPSATLQTETREDWSESPIDRFLLAKMLTATIQPVPKADRYTLVRRLYLDLLGLVPTPAETDAFVNDRSPDAYERLVDRLLASPQYGQHWARSWLDLARYSDTNGYEKDRPRSIWPYRDWVVKAINQDMPYDQFSIEQLAGDMLPDATHEQRIATGFHRNTMLNEEGGIDPLEYRFYAMVDRVATTGTAWMGLTIGCAQCHTHKYDPISHTDYYRMMALLDNADEPDLVLNDLPSEKRSELVRKIERLQSRNIEVLLANEKALLKWSEEQRKYAATWTVATPLNFRTNLPKLTRLGDNSLFASGDFTKRDEYFVTLSADVHKPISAIKLEALPDERLPASGPGRTYYEGRKGQFFLSELEIETEDGKPLGLKSASFSNSKKPNELTQTVIDGDGSSGWSNGGDAGKRHVLVATFAEPVAVEKLKIRLLFERHFVASLGRFRFSVTTDDGDIRALPITSEAEALLTKSSEAWDEMAKRKLAAEYLRTSPLMAKERKPIEKLQNELSSRPHTLVMQERPHDNLRKTHRHHRGEWLSPREEVTGNVLSIFPELSADERNRLGFARWLVSDKNPLFARVCVNRAWRHFMGDGLVRSDGDFGTQSSPPTHPELLDWLACEFIEQGTSMKLLHRQIVMSAAYRQRSEATPKMRNQDPNNEYFARGPRHRVRGETIRDVMLSAGEVMSSRMGGPSVKPPQPSSVTEIAYGNTKWDSAKGEDRYRRSIYTYSKRTAPFAAFTTFDGPTGETCIAKRNRSNTPLQALTLLNDEMYVELAQHIGRSVFAKQKQTRAQIEGVFRRLLTRPPRAEELEQLERYYAEQLDRLQKNELSATEIAGKEDADDNLAALVMVARVVMNLDETITKH